MNNNNNKISKNFFASFLTLVFLYTASIGLQAFTTDNSKENRNLTSATFCMNDSVRIELEKSGTGFLHAIIKPDSLHTQRPVRAGYISFKLSRTESCIVPVRVWIRELDSLGNVLHTQYIARDLVFNATDYGVIVFNEPVEMKQYEYDVVVRF